MRNQNVQVIESGETLANCVIWQMIADHYRESGQTAWLETADPTPYYPTSNAFIAEMTADLVVAFLRDTAPTLDRAEPVYIVEMAAGTGAFAWFFVRALQDKVARFASLATLDLHYVLSDFSESTLDAWEAEPAFANLADAGVLDFALWRPETETTLTLRRAGITLAPDTVKNPVVVLANYFFDSIRHDFFQTENGDLREARITVSRPLPSPIHAMTKPICAEITLNADYKTVSPDAYYADADANAVLSHYAKTLGDGSFLFPVGAFSVMRTLRELTGDRFFLVTSDKGFHDTDYMSGLQAVPYTPHTGSFSYSVNFHAMGEYVRNRAGIAWHAVENLPLSTFAALSWTPEVPLENLRYATETAFVTNNTAKNGYQIASLFSLFDAKSDAPDADLFRAAVACVELAFYDPWVFVRCGEHLCAGVHTDGYVSENTARTIAVKVATHLIRPVFGAREALAYARRLRYILGDYDECLAANDTYRTWYGEERDTFFYPAAIAEARGNNADAHVNYERALTFDPDSDHAKGGYERTRDRFPSA